MPVDISTGKVTAPINLGALASLLGTPNADVGVLCSCQDINMWSKCKPVSYPAPFTNNQWRGTDLHPYGIVIPEGSDISVAAQPVTRIGPSGGQSSPYRIGDFVGYNHQCICPWTVQMPAGSRRASAESVNVSCYLTDSLPEGNLTAVELLGGGYYFCVAVTRGNTTYYRTLDEGARNLDVTSCPLWRGQASLTLRVALVNTTVLDWTTVAPTRFISITTAGQSCTSVITVIAETSSVYKIEASFDDGVRLLSIGETTFDGSYLTAYAGFLEQPTRSYRLSSITITGRSLDGGTDPTPVTVTDLTSVVPISIQLSDWHEGIPLIFDCFAGTRPAGIYKWTYTFNYTAQ